MSEFDIETVNLYRRLSGNPLQSTGFGEKGGMPNLDDDRIAKSIESLVEKIKNDTIEENLDEDQLSQVIDLAQNSLLNLRKTEGKKALLPAEKFITEVVVITDGSRPVIDITSEGLQLDAQILGDWEDPVRAMTSTIEKASQSVGRIDADHLGNNYAGTGFAVGDHLIMTNRHVLDGPLAYQESGSRKWIFKGPATISFAAEPEETTSQVFDLDKVVYASPKPKAGSSQFANLDICLLRCKSKSGQQFPLPLSSFKDAGRYDDGRALYLVGFPARPRRWFQNTPPAAGTETKDVIEYIFRDDFGRKRLAIGEIAGPPGFNASDRGKRIFKHDISTLGGNSGSCILDLSLYGDRVLGLHVGGNSREANYAYALANLQTDLISHGVQYADV